MGVHRPDTKLDESLDARFLQAVEACCEHGNLSGRAFGIASIGDPGLVSSLRRGRSPRVSTVDRVLGFMGDSPLGPAFLGEVEAYLSETGMKRSVLGARAVGNPSFVSQLYRGVSPTLRSVHRVRRWMMAHATAAQWRRIVRRAPPMPKLVSATPARWSFPFGGAGNGSDDLAAAVRKISEGGYKGGCLNTREAAAWAGLKPGTLATYRVRGGGPPYLRLGGLVRYTLEDLEAWLAGRRRRGLHRRRKLHLRTV